jgi:hypothetical protein
MEKEKKPFRIEDLPKKEVFQAAEGYFESLEGKIVAKVNAGRSGKVVHMNTTTRWVGYAAAAVVLAALIWLGGLRLNTTSTAEDLLAEVSSDDLIAYLKSDDIEWLEILAAEPDISFGNDESGLDDLIHDLDEATENDLRELYDILPDDTL